jgi:hypothetical protein
MSDEPVMRLLGGIERRRTSAMNYNSWLLFTSVEASSPV